MKIITKDIPIYYGYFRIVITKDFAKAVKKLKTDIGSHNVSHYTSFVDTGRTKKDISRYTLFIHKNVDHTVIAHEAVHLVNAVFLSINATLDRHNDEPQAYLTGWFVKQCLKALKRKK